MSDVQSTLMSRDWWLPVKLVHENNAMPTVLVGFMHNCSDNRLLPIEMKPITDLEDSKLTWTIKRSKTAMGMLLKSRNKVIQKSHDFSENEDNKKFNMPSMDEIESCLCVYLGIKKISGKSNNYSILLVFILITTR